MKRAVSHFFTDIAGMYDLLKLYAGNRVVFFYYILLSAIFFLPFPAAADGDPTTSGHSSPEQMDGGAPETIEASQRIDLPTAVVRSLSVHPRVQAWRFELEKAEDERKAVRGEFGPSLSVNYRYNELISEEAKGQTDADYLDQATDVVDLSLVQPVFKGFSTLNMYKRSLLQRNWATLQVKNAELKVVHSVQVDFLKLLQAREEVKSFRETVNHLELNLKATRAYYETQMVPYVQVLQANVDLADAQQSLSKAENALITQSIKLNILLGLPAEAKTYFEGSLDAVSAAFSWEMPRCVAHALDHRPDLLATRLDLAMAEKGVSIAKSSYFPTIQIEGHLIDRKNDYAEPGTSALGLPYDRDYESRYWYLGVNVQWNLFNSGKTYHKHQKAKTEVSKQKAVVRELEDEIQVQVRTYYLMMRESWSRIDLTTKAMGAAYENFQMASKQYQLQLISNQTVLNAQDRLARAEANRNQALADYRLSLASLFLAMGLRNDGLGVIS